MVSTSSCRRQRQESQGVTKIAGKSFVQKEGGTRLCYVNIGRERGTKKRRANVGKWPASFSMIKTARKIPSVTSLIASFSDVHTSSIFIYVQLDPR